MSLGGSAVLADSSLQLPHIDYVALAPMLVLFGAACVGVLVEAVLPRVRRYAIQVPLTLAALLVAGVILVVALPGRRVITVGGAVTIDGPALFLQGAIILLGLVAILLIAERRLDRGGPFVAQAAVTAGSEADRRQINELGATEVFPLALFALAGMMLFTSANDLLTMFVALEVLSLPLYLMCALARRRRLLSQEAAVKYFLLGAFASAFFVYGIALIYGFAGRVDFADIHAAVLSSDKSRNLLLIGIGMLSIALLFKIAAVPFHVWTPDVYQGAPTSVTAFMAACTKVAAFGGLARVLYVALGRAQWDFRPVLAVVAALTMLVGAILAVTQTDIKRLLAYSSIANAGYVLTGVLAMTADGVSSTLFYLVAYGFTVIAAFGIVTLVRDADGEATHLSRWAGLGRRSPMYAGLFTFLLLAFAGIPLTSGFTSKFAVFSAALGGNLAWLVIVGVISSMILAFPYLRVVVLMWLSEPAEDTPTVSIPGGFTMAAVTVGALVTLVLGVVPQAALQVALNAGGFLR